MESYYCVLKVLGVLTLFFISVFFYCEWIIYYQAVYRCDWPKVSNGHREATGGLRALVLSDPHILGQTGHWMDRLRREWQMGRSFQAAVFLLEPEIVFILGDLLDHGYHDNHQEWEEDIRRFHQIFHCPSNTELIVVAGNHDVGYYYQLTTEKFQRFQSVFNHSALISKKGVNFVLVTSMALDGDCSVCSEQQAELYSISLMLNCSTQTGTRRSFCRHMSPVPSSAPIILQHFPLYRHSDSVCVGQNSHHRHHLVFRERYDMLSQDASHRLLWWFRPRLLLSGHTHRGCLVVHGSQESKGHPEVSVPSFSWRNKNDPSFLQAVFSSSLYQLSECFLPEESTVIWIYCSAVLLAGIGIAATYTNHTFRKREQMKHSE